MRIIAIDSCSKTKRGCARFAGLGFGLTSRGGRLERGDVAPNETTVALKLVREVLGAEVAGEAGDIEYAGEGQRRVEGSSVARRGVGAHVLF